MGTCQRGILLEILRAIVELSGDDCAQYDIKTLAKTENDENEGIEGSRELVLGLIEKEVRVVTGWLAVDRFGQPLAHCLLAVYWEQVAAGIPHSRIVIGGFSQGAAMAYYTGYQMKTALAGVLILSGYIPKMQVCVYSDTDTDSESAQLLTQRLLSVDPTHTRRRSR